MARINGKAVPRFKVPRRIYRPRVCPDAKQQKLAIGRLVSVKRRNDMAQFRRVYTKQKRPTKLLGIGSSHVVRWKHYAHSRYCINDDGYLLSRSRFVGVGGVKIWELRDQIQGIGLPKHKEHLGNQWGKLLTTKFKPEAITLCIGSNDVDDFELHCRKYRRHMLDPWYYDHLVNRDLQSWYLDLREHIVEIMELIFDAFAGVPILYLSIMPCPWWGKHSRKLARYID